MFALVALPTFLTFTSLVVRFPAMVIVPGEHPINSPDSHRRHLSAPVLLDVVDVDGDGSRRFVYPANTADLTADAARRVESESPGERIDAIRDLAWWTGVCPNYAPFTIPVLVRALGDADPAVKGATAVAIGSIGGNASAAVPGPIAARGTSVHYFDFILEEAIALIEHSPTWPPAEACEMVALEELAR